MDLISTYSALQQNRHVFNIPLFTLEEFLSGLTLEKPADRLLSSTIVSQLMNKISSRQQFRSVLNTSLGYYNNEQTKIRQLKIMSTYSEFNQLSISMKLELISQLVNQALCENCPKYEPDGQAYNDEEFDQVDSFVSLGFDVFGAEWYLLYPDYICVIGIDEPLVLNRNANKLVPLSEYQAGDRPIQKLTYEELLNQKLITGENEKKYQVLDKFLTKNKIFHEKEHRENRKQIDVKYAESLFYNFNVGDDGDKFLCGKSKKLLEKNPLAIENLWRAVENDDLKEFDQIFDEENIEQSQSEDLTQQEQQKQTSFLKQQQALFQQFDKQILTQKDQIAQAEFMMSNELTYKMLNANLVQYSHLSLKLENLQTYFIKINSNEQLFLDLVNAIQFSYFVYFQQKKKSHVMLNATCQICSSLVHNYQIHKSTYEQHLKIFSAPEQDTFVTLSLKTNNFKIVQDKHSKYTDVTFKRAINYKVGNRFIQKTFPTWLSDRQSLSKSNYIDELLIYLGYDEPVYEEPADEIEEVIEEEEKPAPQKQFFYDPYGMDGFIVDGSVSEQKQDEEEPSEREKARQLRRHMRRMQKEQMKLQRQMTRQQRDAGIGVKDQELQQLYGERGMSQMDLIKLRQQVQAEGLKTMAQPKNMFQTKLEEQQKLEEQRKQAHQQAYLLQQQRLKQNEQAKIAMQQQMEQYQAQMQQYEQQRKIKLEQQIYYNSQQQQPNMGFNPNAQYQQMPQGFNPQVQYNPQQGQFNPQQYQSAPIGQFQQQPQVQQPMTDFLKNFKPPSLDNLFK
ncbi:Conserved_hypothetical protein [Hexamita inflata]|uniref:Uncharacterized protein n=1 Tax=Hexamita inflata TaxID=28002 RepID=A0AA86PE44_9EUKA|nr:Conserved hypothetical protein [Hexamita inflata]CAI9937424.1 Conserved hypothetical protein [Hexamita inflata]